MSEVIRAIQCRSYGGAMYPDQKAAAYVCAFCRSSVPWRDEWVFWASPITFCHKSVQIIDGAMKLGHVEVMMGVDPHNEHVLSQKYRLNSVEKLADKLAEKFSYWDDTTIYDIHLLDRLDPWDFGAVIPFDPAFAEDIFRVAAAANNVSRSDVIENLLAERLVLDLKDSFALTEAKIELWGRDFRNHRSATSRSRRPIRRRCRRNIPFTHRPFRCGALDRRSCTVSSRSIRRWKNRSHKGCSDLAAEAKRLQYEVFSYRSLFLP